MPDHVLLARICIGDVDLTLRMETDSEAEHVFYALSDGGQVLMPMKETFFAFRFGQVRDQFGINWMIVHERPMPSRR